MTHTLQTASSAAQLDGLLHTAGIASLHDLGWIRVTGEDRVRWLNGMVTNSITDLKQGQGCYNFVLSAQGRIQGTVNAFAQADSILLQTDLSQIQHLTGTLDRFIIMDDVELQGLSEGEGLLLAGPHALSLLAAIDLTTEALDPLELAEVTWHGVSVDLIAAHSPLIPRYELWGAPTIIATLTEALIQAGAILCEPETLDSLRILEGTPRYGTDIRDRELPQETAQPRALHFAKGCYLGQEIVERIRSRGNVHRTFTGFRLHGALPQPGSAIEAEGKPVGELTSVASIPLPSGTAQIGLGYLRREALERNFSLTYPGGAAVATSLPFALL